MIAAVLNPGTLAAREPLPQILDCVVAGNINWLQGGRAAQNEPAEEPAYTIHLDTRSGEWHLSNAYSAALVVGGGDFTILHDGADYPFTWIGIDDEGATQLRIDAHVATNPFVFLGHDSALHIGTCIEPDEPFLLLR